MLRSLFLAAGMLFCALSGRAWSKKGHELVAQLAYQMLNAKTRSQLESYLGPMPVGDAAAWMDKVRNEKEYRYMRTWHYVNIEAGEDYRNGKGTDIVSALNNAITRLKNHSGDAAALRTDLLTLLHLMGDLHQPLHTGYKSDKGGNSVKVILVKRKSNLHEVWDELIIKKEKIDLADCLALYRTMPQQEVAAYRQGTVQDWMLSSRRLLPEVYNFTGYQLDNQYLQKNGRIIRKQLVIAAIRLASVLRTVLG